MLRVRRSVWLALIAAVCVAMLAPAIELWHAYQTPIHANVAVMTQAQLGQPVTVRITLDGVSLALAHATELQAQTDMQGMAMHLASQRASALPGQASYLVSWAYPMAGTWWVDCSLAMPGYAPWQQRVMVSVAAGGADHDG